MWIYGPLLLLIATAALLLTAVSASDPAEATIVDARPLKSPPLVRRNFRHLEDAANGYNEEFEYNSIMDYSVRFGKCQYVKTYDDEMAQNEDNDDVFALKHLVIFRLCPSDDCNSCNENYGEYILEVDDYLKYIAEYQKQLFEYYCDQCEEECNDDGGNCDSEGCGHECWKYNNLENFGYSDAADYVECQQVNVDLQGDDGEQILIYIGPRCSSDGTRIYIGLFSDENCWEPYKAMTVEEALGYKMSYHLLKNTYSNNGEDCMSCLEQKDQDENNENEVNEMCESLYTASAKCESVHGIQGGFIYENRQDNDFENQVKNEFQVCSFIDSLVWGSYTETGEINIYDEQDVILRQVTPLQKVVLSTLALGMVFISLYALYLNYAINRDYPANFDLSTQGVGELS